jgi:hypothetical protein
MKEPYRKGLASHPGPQSCAGGRKVAGEALAGAHAGQPLSAVMKRGRIEDIQGIHADNSLHKQRSKAKRDATKAEAGARPKDEKGSGSVSLVPVAWLPTGESTRTRCFSRPATRMKFFRASAL